MIEICARMEVGAKIITSRPTVELIWALGYRMPDNSKGAAAVDFSINSNLRPAAQGSNPISKRDVSSSSPIIMVIDITKPKPSRPEFHLKSIAGNYERKQILWTAAKFFLWWLGKVMPRHKEIWQIMQDVCQIIRYSQTLTFTEPSQAKLRSLRRACGSQIANVLF